MVTTNMPHTDERSSPCHREASSVVERHVCLPQRPHGVRLCAHVVAVPTNQPLCHTLTAQCSWELHAVPLGLCGSLFTMRCSGKTKTRREAPPTQRRAPLHAHTTRRPHFQKRGRAIARPLLSSALLSTPVAEQHGRTHSPCRGNCVLGSHDTATPARRDRPQNKGGLLR